MCHSLQITHFNLIKGLDESFKLIIYSSIVNVARQCFNLYVSNHMDANFIQSIQRYRNNNTGEYIRRCNYC